MKSLQVVYASLYVCMLLTLKTNGGGTTVAGWSLAVLTAVTVGILLRRRVSRPVSAVRLSVVIYSL